MNRREVLQALALPATARISHLEVRPSSVIVVEISESISQQTALRLQETLRQVWPDPQRILVLDGGARIKVVDE